MTIQLEQNIPVPHGALPVDPRAPGILARSTYNELRSAGLSESDIMAFAGELLSLVASGVRERPMAG